MTNHLKKIIIILIILSIIVGIVLSVLLMRENGSYSPILSEINEPHEDRTEEEVSKSISILKDDNDFYTIETTLKNYLLYLKMENVEVVKEVVDKEYMEQNNINENNIIASLKEKIANYDGNFELEEVYIRDSLNTCIYYAYSTLSKNNNVQEFYAKIYVDRSNMAYAISVTNKEDYQQYISEKKKDSTEKEIIKQKYNKFKVYTLTDEQKAKRYFNDYIYTALSNPQKGYELIQSEYRKSKFPDLNSYKEYLDFHKKELETLNARGIKSSEDFSTEEEYTNYLNNLVLKGIDMYKFSGSGDKRQCICIDDYGNYYIFYITGSMQYTVILDTYTIDLPEFKIKYATATDEDKVLMNIQKFFEAIDDGDYRYAYNKLDATYRNNNFKTLAEFGSYVKNNFFEQNKLAAGNAQKQGDVYLYNVNITDKTGKDEKTISKSFVMQLKEGTDFVMSFSAK